ncbi:septal ring lytic transglycosylase RlpA family protein [Chitinophaga agrisoli]|uniref:Probable endolytic peptidoglycan transglycosylase RlpA n=1 Tax=Chitinophaga agrisoli TaxID=2607653 RepID=A0A5B2VUF6_9BACT|nr:septal ring lytic transglycosylase RlpA family protein [Chitinophaga agrisoli]KAA2241942.1 septal ring lytic transglycosylase RlpA family protein [Chitinophaga agrisoli]
MKRQIVKWTRYVIVCLCAVLLLSLPLWLGREEAVQKESYKGTASYYANKFNGRRTANGEIFSNQEMTAAHNSLPLGTYVKVTNLRNGRSVIVRITDRLHPDNRRIIDLTQLAARQLGFLSHGLTKVSIEIV